MVRVRWLWRKTREGLVRRKVGIQGGYGGEGRADERLGVGGRRGGGVEGRPLSRIVSQYGKLKSGIAHGGCGRRKEGKEEGRKGQWEDTGHERCVLEGRVARKETGASTKRGSRRACSSIDGGLRGRRQ